MFPKYATWWAIGELHDAQGGAWCVFIGLHFNFPQKEATHLTTCLVILKLSREVRRRLAVVKLFISVCANWRGAGLKQGWRNVLWNKPHNRGAVAKPKQKHNKTPQRTAEWSSLGETFIWVRGGSDWTTRVNRLLSIGNQHPDTRAHTCTHSWYKSPRRDTTWRFSHFQSICYRGEVFKGEKSASQTHK